MDKTRYQSSAAEKWFGKANQYEPKPGTDYEWVWEYAKFRLAWATERVQHIEDKALEFLKLILAFGAAGWAVLTVVLHVKLNEISNLPKWLGIVSFAVFLASVGFALWAYLPTKRLLPVAEDAALRCADTYGESSKGMAKFAQTLSSATEYETDVAASKAKQLWLAAFFLSLALILFLCAAFLGGYR